MYNVFFIYGYILGSKLEFEMEEGLTGFWLVFKKKIYIFFSRMYVFFLRMYMSLEIDHGAKGRPQNHS